MIIINLFNKRTFKVNLYALHGTDSLIGKKERKKENNLFTFFFSFFRFTIVDRHLLHSVMYSYSRCCMKKCLYLSLLQMIYIESNTWGYFTFILSIGGAHHIYLGLVYDHESKQFYTCK